MMKNEWDRPRSETPAIFTLFFASPSGVYMRTSHTVHLNVSMARSQSHSSFAPLCHHHLLIGLMERALVAQRLLCAIACRISILGPGIGLRLLLHTLCVHLCLFEVYHRFSLLSAHLCTLLTFPIPISTWCHRPCILLFFFLIIIISSLQTADTAVAFAPDTVLLLHVYANIYRWLYGCIICYIYIYSYIYVRTYKHINIMCHSTTISMSMTHNAYNGFECRMCVVN